MRKLFTVLSFSLLSLSSFAQLQSGYYRVMNNATKSQRFIYVADGVTDIDYTNLDWTLAAIELYKDQQAAIQSPATVLYVENRGNGTYDIKGQNTGIHKITDMYVSPKHLSGDLYQLSASKSGQTIYLTDASSSSTKVKGKLSSTGSQSTWKVIPLDGTSNYVGVNAPVSVSGKYYAPYYASYPFTLSEGMKAYYVSSIDYVKSRVIIKEIKGTVPGMTPVLLECTSASYKDNKITPNTDNIAAPSANLLSGTFFATGSRDAVKSRTAKDPQPKIPYDKNTMRVLGVTSAGKLGFVTAKNDDLVNVYSFDSEMTPLYCIKSNNSYLQVNTNSSSEFTVLTEEELAAIPVEDIYADSPKDNTIYTVTGVKVSGMTKNGVYIINGKKYIKQ